MATREYRMSVVVQLDEEQRNELVDKTRRAYAQNPVSGLNDDEVEYDLPPKEYVASTSDVLMELIHSCFDSTGVEVQEIS